MINIEEIEKEISELESKETTYANVEKLAWLYIVKEHYTKSEREIEIQETQLFPKVNKTEFLNIASKAPTEEVLNIMDNHLSSIKVLYPREYDNIIRKIQKIGFRY